MNLRQYLNGMVPDDQVAFAQRCGTTVGYMRKALSTGQRFGGTLCVAIERESHQTVTRKDLRDDWQKLWPELGREAA
ncbi:transcriptional regulator [Paludibacterium yongneupense]|uniref:transcriptional regulator n=1 Tax=Paludibacterium yongneupense TaxID=400061 RepID=UPI0005608C42|nr:YdaS family helix-turn-helix protein [Paludibacterium yongneupense]